MIRKLIHSYFLFFSEIDTKKFVLANRMGGTSTDRLYQIYAGKFSNTAITQFKKTNQNNNNQNSLKGATIITTSQECQKCLQVLMQTNTIVAWDTQTMDLDIKNQSPVGKGKIVCASFFAGPQFDFGNGARVFIDNFGKNYKLINEFKPYLQNVKYKKVWHNYGFDRHLFYNHGINVQGFAADTMHMARLLDAAKIPGSYSLSSLTKEYNKEIEQIIQKYIQNKKQFYLKKNSQVDNKQEAFYSNCLRNLQKYSQDIGLKRKIKKTKMEELFKKKKILKSGKEGITYEFPSILTLHTNQEYISDWIQYSLLDSQSTFYLRQTLQALLKQQKSTVYQTIPNMWVLYEKYWQPFGELLTDMQREGIKIDFQHIQYIKILANQQLIDKKKQFMNFLLQFQKDSNIDYFNPSSPLQLQQLLHAPYNRKQINNKSRQNTYSSEQKSLIESSLMSEQIAYEQQSKGRQIATLHEETKIFKVDNEDKSRGKRKIEMSVKGLGLPPIKFTPLGLPSVDSSVLSILAGNPQIGQYGTAFQYFNAKGEPQFGKSLCIALGKLIEYNSIETILKTFIEPLKGFANVDQRVHCSLNLNTETGRLSARKPNLQNQPALDKDSYKIRKAFIAQQGKKFIIADYGQLELRVLAHLSNCKEMIKAFQQGGDFHSRTAIGMYDYIKKQLNEGTIILEWDKQKGKAPAPLLKEKYANERKKAKTVNFSIAYGKTAKGFAQDWNCTHQEAVNIINSWFANRPEVQQWQSKVKEIAEHKKYTQTLLGRFRRLNKFFQGYNNSLRGLGFRRSINTPVQGGAADIVIASMVKIHSNEKLKRMGWKLLLQIHDELILQGPKQNVQQALQLVKLDMQHPFDTDLLVSLQIDAKIAQNWYQGK